MYYDGYLFLPPVIFTINQIMSATASTTTIMPVHTPALKMPSITEQLVNNVVINAKIEIGMIE